MTTRREFLARTSATTLAAALSGCSGSASPTDVATGPRASVARYRVPHTDLLVTRIAYGVGMLGIDQHGTDFVTRTKALIRTAYDNGITFFDIADHYGAGKSETALGEALHESPGLRHRIVLQSKCGIRVPEGWVPGDPIQLGATAVDLSREHIIRSVEGSLRRLNTDHLDILLLHMPDILMRPDEVAQAFEELRRSGKVRHFGVSNHSAMQIELLKKHLKQPLIANQIQLGLAHYYPLSEARVGFGSLVDYCRLHDIQVQAFSPLKGDDIFGSAPLLNIPQDAHPAIRKATDALEEIARRHGVSSAALMLAWLLHHPAGIVPIIGATKAEHIADNCTADRVKLTRQEWYTLFNAAAEIQSQI